MQLIYYLKNIIAFLLFKILMSLPIHNNRGKGNSILFVQLGRLGDVVLSTPIFASELFLNDNSKYYFLTEKYFKPLFESYRGKINLMYVDLRKYKWNIFYRVKILSELCRLSPQIVFNLSFTRVSVDDEVSIIAGAKGETFAFENNKNLKRLFAKNFEKYYSEIISVEDKDSIVNLTRLIHYGLKVKIKKCSIIFPGNNAVNSLFGGNYFVVSPIASRKIKEWNIKNYNELIKIICAKTGLKAVIVGKGKIKHLANIANVKNLVNKTTLKQAVFLIYRSSFFIGNDSGLLHISIALNKPSFGIIGCGEWGSIYPYDNGNKKVAFFFSTQDCCGCKWNCKFSAARCLQNVSPKFAAEKIISIINE